MIKQEKMEDGFVLFQDDSEAKAFYEWLHSENLQGRRLDLAEYDAQKNETKAENFNLGVDLGQVVANLNAMTIPSPTTVNHHTMSPLPTIPNYSDAVVRQNNSNRKRITATTLRNKVLANCRLVVKDGVVHSFDGRCYRPLTEDQVKQLIVAICEQELGEAGRFDLVTGALNFILVDPHIQVYEDIRNRRILTFMNGNLDVETGEFRGHSPELFTTYTIQCHYIGNAENMSSPVFDNFIHRISGGDPEIKARIWEMMGYCLVPDLRAKKGFVLQGRKHSGKSLLCNLLESFFSPDVVSALAAHSFADKFALSELVHSALCVSGDMPAESLSDRVVANIKGLSGDDLLSSPVKFKKNAQFRFGGKLVLVSNHQILPRHRDDAFWDRLIAIPFPYTIPPEEQDGNLLERLKMERDVIASKAIMAYWCLKERAYRFSGSYILNSGDFLFDDESQYSVDLRPAIQAFLLQNFCSASYDKKVFMADAHALFEQCVASIPLTAFGNEFGGAAATLLNAKKDRKYKPGATNATSCLLGITYKNTKEDDTV